MLQPSRLRSTVGVGAGGGQKEESFVFGYVSTPI